jgi:PKD repeat protein
MRPVSNVLLGALLAGLMLAGCPETPTPPTAQFQVSATKGIAPLTVQFTDRSQAGSTPIAAWLWNFGAGTNATSTDRNPVYTFTSPGHYTVVLWVTSTSGETVASASCHIDAIAAGAGPAAAFDADVLQGSAPLTVQFTDRSEAGGAALTSWLWRFGDGAKDSVPDPVHTYAEPGVYTVALRVANAYGADSTTKTGLITVTSAPQEGEAEGEGANEGAVEGEGETDGEGEIEGEGGNEGEAEGEGGNEGEGSIEGEGETPDLAITHTLPDGNLYAIGAPVSITVDMTYSGTEAITALAVEETLPSGWTFQTTSGANVPNLASATGTTGTLYFAWLTIPAFPVRFTFTTDFHYAFRGIHRGIMR